MNHHPSQCQICKAESNRTARSRSRIPFVPLLYHTLRDLSRGNFSFADFFYSVYLVTHSGAPWLPSWLLLHCTTHREVCQEEISIFLKFFDLTAYNHYWLGCFPIGSKVTGLSKVLLTFIPPLDIVILSYLIEDFKLEYYKKTGKRKCDKLCNFSLDKLLAV